MRNFFLGLSTIVPLTVLTLAAGCGSSVVGTGGSGGTSTGSGTQSTATGTQSTGTGTPGGCPAAEPTGGSCVGLPSGLACTYGSSVRPECRDQWSCASGNWEAPGNVCAMSPICPAAQPSASTVCQPSNPSGDVCTYGDTICLCAQCVGLCTTPPIKWQCSPPPTTPGCPSIAPNEGTPCTSNGLACTYGNPCSQSGAATQCMNDVWAWVPVACPG
jgi:hypothetical protein